MGASAFKWAAWHRYSAGWRWFAVMKTQHEHAAHEYVRTASLAGMYVVRPMSDPPRELTLPDRVVEHQRKHRPLGSLRKRKSSRDPAGATPPDPLSEAHT